MENSTKVYKTTCQTILIRKQQINNFCYFRFADQVSIGHEVLVQRNNNLVPEKVIDVDSLMIQGSYYFHHLPPRFNDSR